MKAAQLIPRLKREYYRPSWKKAYTHTINETAGQGLRIKVIPAIRSERKILRVAAYCRVSTNLTEQELSLDSQERHYRDMIAARDDWTLAGIYADRGFSGTSSDRPAFQKMLKDAKEGQIDLILTKSISRFARNVTELLKVVRTLPARVRFEKENLDTGTIGTEFYLTMLAAFAEEESRSISGNVKWSIRKRFMNGSYVVSKPAYGYLHASDAPASRTSGEASANSNTTGASGETSAISNTAGASNEASVVSNMGGPNKIHDTSPDSAVKANDASSLSAVKANGKTSDKYEIDDRAAAIVRLIFAMVLEGHGCYEIADELNDRHIPSPGGGRWTQGTVLGIVRNPFYKGELHLQKTYTDHTFRQRPNRYEADQYIIEESHLGIIDAESFARAQSLIDMRRSRNNRHSPQAPYSGLLFCGCCASALNKDGNDRYRCKSRENCRIIVHGRDLRAAFVTVLNKLSFSEQLPADRQILAAYEKENEGLRRAVASRRITDRYGITDGSVFSHFVERIEAFRFFFRFHFKCGLVLDEERRESLPRTLA